jgi:putative hemolysin
LVLVLANGFFVAAEFSLVGIRRSRVEQLVAEKRPFAPAVQRATTHLDSYLAATQLGITIASIGLGWIGEPTLAALIDPLFRFLPDAWEQAGSHAVAVALAFAVITGLHITLGELAPKSLALQRTESTALAVSQPLTLFFLVFRPAIWLLNEAGNSVVRLVGLHPAATEEQVHSIDELKYLVMTSRRAGVVDPMESDIVSRVLGFGETRAHQVMVPRTDVVGTEANAPLADVVDRMLQHGYSRLPVYAESLDDVVGVVHLRDLVNALRRGHTPETPVREVMRQPLVVPESASAEEILTRMRQQRTHIAIVIDEHGGTAGLVTMEDLLEEIVGDVQDEFDRPTEVVQPQTDGSFLVDGGLGLVEFVERFDLPPIDEDCDTVGGLVMARLDRVPQVGDLVALPNARLTVEVMDGRRVRTVRLRRE